ncbi:4Fe-4S binding protein, partial [bacterium]|nr:4Fe-4S binding protein [bacterium]
FVQYIFTLIFNSYFYFVNTFMLYSGSLKKVCCPGLNCYSCPLAVTSCPIGAIQAVAGGMPHKFSLYMFSFLGVIGMSTGRAVCGWLCPFGLFQDLIHKIPFWKYDIKYKFRIMKYTKYMVLIIFVFLMPAFLVDDGGYSKGPSFCKYICPAGTVEAGLPLLAIEKSLPEIGMLFYFKLSILILIIIMTLMMKRPFCRYLCPLGAIYSLFNRFSIYNIKRDTDKCINCLKCEKVCPMDVKLVNIGKDTECIRCSDCVKACPVSALRNGIL